MYHHSIPLVFKHCQHPFQEPPWHSRTHQHTASSNVQWTAIRAQTSPLHQVASNRIGRWTDSHNSCKLSVFWNEFMLGKIYSIWIDGELLKTIHYHLYEYILVSCATNLADFVKALPKLYYLVFILRLKHIIKKGFTRWNEIFLWKNEIINFNAF